MRSTAVPLAVSFFSPISSTNPGSPNWKLAKAQLTSRVTRYVPLPVGSPAPDVCQVPPPVADPDGPPPAGATNVPEPVSLIWALEGLVGVKYANANASPPALRTLPAPGGTG